MYQQMLGDPLSIIAHYMLHLDNVCSALVHSYRSYLYKLTFRLESLTGRLHKLSPVQQLSFKQQWTRELSRRLQTVMQQQLNTKRSRLQSSIKLLEAIGPQEVLGRGYAVVRSGQAEKPPGELIRSSKQVTVGKDLEIILQEGKLGCEVTEIKKNGRDERI